MVGSEANSEWFCRIGIIGNHEFRTQARRALALLQPLNEFRLVQTHLAAIRQGRRSGVTAWAENPVFTAGAPTWSHSPHWFAGAIAHDAFHAKLYRDAKHLAGASEPALETWSGTEAEQACLRFQHRVLVALQADPILLEHLEKHLRNPTYQGRCKGLRGWLDYRKRWW